MAGCADKLEHEIFELFMVGLRWVEVGENSIATGEVKRRRKSTSKNVLLFNFGGVEKGRETLAVKQNDDVRVRGDERSRWHIDFKNSRLIFLNPRLEELIPPLIVKVVMSITYRSDNRKTMIAGNLLDWKILGC